MVTETATINDTCVVTIPERLDAGNAPGIEKEIKEILSGAHQKNVVFDFSRTSYIASAGLRVLLQLTRDQMKAGGKIALAGLKPPVLKVFEMAGFTSIFTICGSREEALQKIK
jgi:anti-anti-sigma factor